MAPVNVKELLHGVDEEQLYLIITALEDAATRFDSITARKMEITAHIVSEIKKAREEQQALKLLGDRSSRKCVER